MRTLFYLLVFIAPTALVLIYRDQIRTYLEDQGLLGRVPTKEEAPAESGASPKISALDQSNSPAENETSSAPTTPSNPVARSGSDIDSQVAKKHPLPTFKPLETLVANWRKVPPAAFPKMVTLKKPVDLELIIDGRVGGKSTLRVGQQAYPISLEGTLLTVSGNPGNTTMKGTITVDDTDFKAQIRKTYDTWKQRQESRVQKLRKVEKQRLLTAGPDAVENAPTAAPSSANSELGKEPSVNLDGSVPVMVDSIRAGDVKEIELASIEYWRWNGYEEVGGKPYYTGVVGYRASTIFGEINTEGKALIRNGKVEKWIYNGSEEEIN